MIHLIEYKHAYINEVLNLNHPDEIEQIIWKNFCNFYKPTTYNCSIRFYVPKNIKELKELDYKDWQIEIINRLENAGVALGTVIYLDM